MFAYACIFVLGVIIAIKRHELIGYICVSLFIIFDVLILLIKYYKFQGLYITENKIYYKSTKKVDIRIKDVKGIIKIQAYSSGGKYRGFYPLSDNKGNKLYTAVFVKNITDEMLQFNKGDLWFIQKFKQDILTWSIYSEDAIVFLKENNPDIIIKELV